jgi:predicted phosphodiesterase
MAEELIAKFPDMETDRIAKIIDSHLQGTVEYEKIRSAIKLAKYGDITRRNGKTYIYPGMIDKIKLPESKAEAIERFQLPSGIKKVLVLSDVHIPYHDIRAIEAALEHGHKQGIDCIFLNGDILDLYQLSDHEKDPRKVSFKGELDAGREFLAELRRLFPAVPIYYIPGNHENRMERFLYKNPQLLGNPEFRLDSLLQVASHGVTWIEHSTAVYFGKLLVEHGDKLRGSGGVNPARTLLLKFKRPTICGHFHRTSQANGVIYDDSTLMAWSSGCLCELSPQYMPVNEWNHGASIIELFDNGQFHVENFQIIKGKVY